MRSNINKLSYNRLKVNNYIVITKKYGINCHEFTNFPYLILLLLIREADP